MDFERTKHGEVMALARLLNVSENDVIDKAREIQIDLTDLKQMCNCTYEYVMDALKAYADARAENEDAVFGETEDDDDLPSLEDELDKCETWYEERILRSWYANERWSE